MNHFFHVTSLMRFLFLAILAYISYQDLKSKRIPDHCHLLLLLLSLFTILLHPGISLTFPSRILGALCVSLPFLFLTLAKPGCIGGGDIKLCFAAGFYLGLRRMISATVYGLLFAGIYILLLLLLQKYHKGDSIALAPFLCLGMALVASFGRLLF